jgi:hypothetical protein
MNIDQLRKQFPDEDTSCISLMVYIRKKLKRESTCKNDPILGKTSEGTFGIKLE